MVDMEKIVSLSPTTDTTSESYRQAPHNTEMEQAVLGAILMNNDALHHIDGQLRPEHFYEPLHARIFETIQRQYDKGLIANPVTLRSYFEQDPALADSNAAQYLAQLASAAAAIINVKEYSEHVIECAQKRALIEIGSDMVNDAYTPDMDRHAADQIAHAEAQLYNLASEGTVQKAFKSLAESAQIALKNAEVARKRTGDVVGLPTKLNKLDNMLGGLQKSDLLILAGRPSMGKTALATNIAHEIAKYFEREAHDNHQKPESVAFFSLEMSAEQLAGRLLSSESGLNSSDIRKGDLNNEQFSKLIEASARLNKLPLYIDDTPALSISAVRTRARRLKRVHNLGLIVVDYLQLLRGSSSRSNESRVLEISEITMGLKAIAKELNIPVLALSQLSRAVEQRPDKRPQLSDLRESGSIEQDADVVMFVFREEYYHLRNQPREGTPEHATWQQEMDRIMGIAEVLVAKHRHGAVGNIPLAFQSDQAKFGNLDENRFVKQHEEQY